MKKCFKCEEVKPLSEFYKHKQMADGHLNKCKICTKKDVKKHRDANLDKAREYDRARNSMPHRVAARTLYQKTDAYKLSHAESVRKYRKNHPQRYFAKTCIGNALRDGRIKKLPCWVCGSSEVEGHHPDYNAPLDVVWLCQAHHKEIHLKYPR